MNHNSSGTPDYPNLQFNVILLYSYTQKIYEELAQKNMTVDTIVKKLLTWQYAQGVKANQRMNASENNDHETYSFSTSIRIDHGPFCILRFANTYL